LEEKQKKWLYIVGNGCGRGAVACTVGAIVLFCLGTIVEITRDVVLRNENKRK
jgi:hypothetical protein